MSIRDIKLSTKDDLINIIYHLIECNLNFDSKGPKIYCSHIKNYPGGFQELEKEIRLKGHHAPFTQELSEITKHYSYGLLRMSI